MKKFTTHTGVGVPMQYSNVDTDQIIPAGYLKRVSRTGFEDGLFANWRKNDDFVLNREEFRNGSVLFVGPDFGTGSSREHAVWALGDYGFRAVFSPRFADIFRGNAGKAGLLAGIMEQSDIELIWKQLEAEPGTEATVDLESRSVDVGGNVYPFEGGDYSAWRLREGLDDIGLAGQNGDAISDFESRRPRFKPQVR